MAWSPVASLASSIPAARNEKKVNIQCCPPSTVRTAKGASGTRRRESAAGSAAQQELGAMTLTII